MKKTFGSTCVSANLALALVFPRIIEGLDDFIWQRALVA
jgi:hypothetical protein